MGLLQATEEKRTQLFFHDGGSFEFRKLPFVDTCLVVKQDNTITKAWKHFYSNQIRFDGYKNFHADLVSLGYDRDFILDPFNRVPVLDNPGGKPGKTNDSIKKWTAQIAESQRQKVNAKPGTSLLVNKIVVFLGIGLILQLLLWGLLKGLKVM